MMGDLKRCIRAIRARLDGEWDNPELYEVGAMTPNTEADIWRIKAHYGVIECL